MDLIAKAPFLSINQHNGYFGCSTCLIEGVRTNNVQTYPYEQAMRVSKRTDAGTFSDAKQAVAKGEKVLGCVINCLKQA